MSINPTGSEILELLVVDNHPLFIQGIHNVLAPLDSRIRIASTSFQELGTEHMNHLRPDILILGLPDSTTAKRDLMSLVRSYHSNITIILLSRHSESKLASQLIEAGAAGQLDRSLTAQEFLRQFMSLLQIKFDRFSQNKKLRTRRVRHNLKHRELEVLKLLSQSLSSKEIASRLNISKHTVDNHRKNILRKTGLTNTAGVIVWALESGLITSTV